MCIASIVFQPESKTPVVCGFNRDELYSRKWLSPDFHWDNTQVYAGKDLDSGGTWLGINAYGLIVGIINKESNHKLNASTLKSRGVIALTTLNCKSVEAAIAMLIESNVCQYRAFNMFVFSRSVGYWVTNRKNESNKLHIDRVKSGIHMISKTFPNDMKHPRIRENYNHFKYFQGDITQFQNKMQLVSSKSDAGMLLEKDKWGTLSSSVIVVRANQIAYYFTNIKGQKTTQYTLKLSESGAN